MSGKSKDIVLVKFSRTYKMLSAGLFLGIVVTSVLLRRRRRY